MNHINVMLQQANAGSSGFAAITHFQSQNPIPLLPFNSTIYSHAEKMVNIVSKSSTYHMALLKDTHLLHVLRCRPRSSPWDLKIIFVPQSLWHNCNYLHNWVLPWVTTLPEGTYDFPKKSATITRIWKPYL